MKRIKNFLFVVMFTLLSINANAQWLGSGTSADPWQISSIADLKALSTLVMNDVNYGAVTSGKYWKLMNDLDMVNITNYIPIGGWYYYNLSGCNVISSSIVFMGNFDGNGKTIRNLTINKSTIGACYNPYYVGLFGNISSATIKNISLVNAQINGYNYVGGIVGYCKYKSIISKCFVDGRINGNTYVGGLVGENSNSNIFESCSKASVSATGPNAYIGGLVGTNISSSSIQNCYFTGDITSSGTSAYVGGLVGLNSEGSTIFNCYTAPSAIISTSTNTGAFIGYKTDGFIYNNYFCTNLGINGLGTFDIGNDPIGKTDIELKATDMIALLNGLQNPSPWKLNYMGYPVLSWQSSSSPFIQTDPIIFNGNTSITLNGKINDNTNPIISKGFEWKSESENIWKVLVVNGVELTSTLTNLTTNINYQIRAYAITTNGTNYGEIINFNTSGNGTPNNPYYIYTIEDLISLSTLVMHDANNGAATTGKYWKLMNDLDMNGVTNFIPIGGWSNATTNSTSRYFKGTFDGNNKFISNLKLNTDYNKSYVGLFGYIYKGIVKNLIIKNASINTTGRGDIYAGALTGKTLFSIISNCAVDGILYCDTEIGGLIGNSGYSFISNCASVCYIHSLNGINSKMGGLIGNSARDIISNCYSRVSLSLSSIGNIGGLIGDNSDSYISNCYTSPLNIESPSSDKGIFIGFDVSWQKFKNNYYNTSIILGVSAIGYGNPGVLPIGVDDAVLRSTDIVTLLNASQTPSPWKADYTPIGLNDGYPILSWQMMYCEASFNDNGGQGSMNSQIFAIDINQNLYQNTFTKEGYLFNGWNTKADGTGISYTDEESISITEDITLYAQWRNYEITFDTNGGEGTMIPQIFVLGVNQNIYPNTFTKEGNLFNGWNTKAYGTGISYTDEESISITEDITLYAQWSCKVIFDANGGEGSINTQTFDVGVNQNLYLNTFTKEGYLFNGWNTKADETGISYTDEESISITEDITLYAQWSIIINNINNQLINTSFLYPNPAKKQITVNNGNQIIKEIIITDAIGKIILIQNNINKTQININISDLKDGIYFVICTQENNIQRTMKMIKVK